MLSGAKLPKIRTKEGLKKTLTLNPKPQVNTPSSALVLGIEVVIAVLYLEGMGIFRGLGLGLRVKDTCRWVGTR